MTPWNSMKEGLFDNSQERTLDLANEMKNATFTGQGFLESCHSIQYQTTENFTTNDVNAIVRNAVNVLNKNPKMLEYKFNENGELTTILVHSNVNLLKQVLTSDRDICESACNVYAAIQLFIENHNSYNKSKTTVPVIKPDVILTEKLKSKCNFGVVTATGGSKSRRRHRRKPARKTRRGRIRKSKAKAKTHRRRRHSRVRKSKINTYTRRR